MHIISVQTFVATIELDHFAFIGLVPSLVRMLLTILLLSLARSTTIICAIHT